MLLCIIRADNSRGTSNPLRKVDGKLGVSTAPCRGQAEPHPGGRKYFSLALTSSGPLVSPKLYDKKNNIFKKMKFKTGLASTCKMPAPRLQGVWRSIRWEGKARGLVATWTQLRSKTSPSALMGQHASPWKGHSSSNNTNFPPRSSNIQNLPEKQQK